jgi:hypothetical protein
LRRGELDGAIESVSTPSYGTGYLFTARDCRVVSTNPADLDAVRLRECGGTRFQQWTFPSQAVLGGGLGFGGFSQSHVADGYRIDIDLEHRPAACITGIAACIL